MGDSSQDGHEADSNLLDDGVYQPLAREEQNDRSIFELLNSHEWEEVKTRCESHPSEARTIDARTGSSPLHLVCSIGSAPAYAIEACASAAPEMVKLKEKRFQDSPLHIVCRNSQTSAEKAETVLKFCDPEDLLMQNVIGGTPLHSACGHNALLSVLQHLVRTNPALLRKNTNEGVLPLRALFHSYMQSIPGHLAVGKMLKGRTVTEGHFERFWNKTEFMAKAFYQLRIGDDALSNFDDYIAHSLLFFDAPLNLIKIALIRNVDWARVIDSEGNTLLHLLVERRPYRLKELEALEFVIRGYPGAVQVRNNNKQLPLFLAIRNKIPWENGLGEILRASPATVRCRDAETGLYPFQLTAAVGGPEGINSTFNLLCSLPEMLCS